MAETGDHGRDEPNKCPESSCLPLISPTYEDMPRKMMMLSSREYLLGSKPRKAKKPQPW